MKRVISFLMVFSMLISIMPLSVLTDASSMGEAMYGTPDTEESNVKIESSKESENRVFWRNPIFSEIPLDSDSANHSAQVRATTVSPRAQSEYISVEEAGKELRRHIINRNDYFNLSFYVPMDEYTSSDSTWDLLLNYAAEHTGTFYEGDHILLSVYSVGYSMDLTFEGDRVLYTFTDIDPYYWLTSEEEQELRSAVSQTVKALSLAGKSDYEKAFAVYDYICQNVVYDYDAADAASSGSFEYKTTYRHSFSAYGALINKTAVCEGYADLLYLMLLECGIDNRIQIGGSHAWNIVSVEDMYYYCDSTWDYGLSDYRWFLKGSADFRIDYNHRPTNDYVTAEYTNAFVTSSLDYSERNSGPEPNQIISSGSCGDALTWELHSDGKLVVKGNGPMTNGSSLSSDLWNGMRGWIKCIVLEEGVTSVGDYAFFNCTALEEVSLPNTLTYIGTSAFAWCDNLRSFFMPDSVQTVGGDVFCCDANLADVKLSEQLTFLSDTMFAVCGSLKVFDIPASVTSLGHMTFNAAFSKNDETPFVIPNTVASIGDGCFMYTGLRKVVWPDSVHSIGNMMFYHAYYLNEVNIPETVTHIGPEVFSHCTNIVSINIPDSVTEVEHGAFYQCEQLESIDLSNQLTEIGQSLFNFCYSLKNFVVPEHVVSIGYGAFSESGLEEIILQENLVTIGVSAFSSCENLKKIVIPESVNELSSGAFAWCYNLETVIFKGNVPIFGENSVLREIKPTCYYPSNNKTWTEDKLQNYGGNPTWVAYEPDDKGHCWIDETIQNATCIDNGLIEWVCLICGDIKEEIIAAQGHIWSEAGTCTSCGVFRCALEGHVEVTMEAISPSCAEYGWTEGKSCAVCGEVLVAQEPIQPIGHNYDAVEFNWSDDYESCTAVAQCSHNCGEDLLTDCYITKKTTDPSCLENGKITYSTWLVIDDAHFTDEKTEIIPAIGHDWDEGVNNEEAGLKIFTCNNCGDTKTESIPEGDHVHRYESVITEPTCTENGITTHTCKCGDSYTDNVIAALGHSWNAGVVTREPTESSPGIRTYTCTVCRETRTEEISMQDHSHNYTAVVTDPTCTEDGYTTYTCSCGDSLISGRTDALGHTEVTVPAVAATCTTAGKTEGKYCSVCNEVLVAQGEIPAKGHTFNNWVEGEGQKSRECVNCAVTETLFDFTGSTTVSIEDTEASDAEFKMDDVMDPEDGRYILVEEALKAEEEKDHEILHVFDITMEENGQQTQPDGTVKVKLLDEWEDDIIYKVYYVSDDGNCVDMYAYWQGEYIIFDTDHFSLYVLLKVTAKENPSTPEHRHNYTAAVTKPTCTEKGYTTYICSCGDTYTGNEVAALGHKWDNGVVTKQPTAAAPGVKTFTCTVCKETRTEEIPYEVPVQNYVLRISGKDRVKTALSVAKALKDTLKVDKFDAVFIATGVNEKFADALAGSYLANTKKAPILLYTNSGLSQLNVNFIKENLSSNGTVYILGGTGAIPATVEDTLSAYNVVRLSGKTRYETNLAILKEAGVASANEILVATGTNFADSLSASAVGLPLMLVDGKASKLSDVQVEFLRSVAGKKITILGGTGAVSEDIENAIEAVTNVAAERISGKTRHNTSVMIAQKYFNAPEFALLTYSQNFPDGLAGGPLAYAMGAPLLLTSAGQEAIANEYIAAEEIESGYVLGGDAAVSDATARKAFGLAADAAINKAYYTE